MRWQVDRQAVGQTGGQVRWQVGGSTDTDRHSGMGGWERWQVGRQRQARDGWASGWEIQTDTVGWVGGRDGKWVDRDRLGMDGRVGEMASG